MQMSYGNNGQGGESHEGPTRRHFLRRAGVIGAVAAAFIGGGAELAGMSASAAVRSKGQKPHGGTGLCTYDKGACGKTCPSGQCCYRCVCPGGKTVTSCTVAHRPGCQSYTINCP